ncbi:hypothetical protein K8353_21885 [Burkholderia contaminans]|nr:hypothetical protein [Burkholderia contaminans]
MIFSASEFGAQTASRANPAKPEFLYFIQRPDRICSDDPKPCTQRFFNFRNDVLPMRSRRRTCRQGFLRDIARADISGYRKPRPCPIERFL